MSMGSSSQVSSDTICILLDVYPIIMVSIHMKVISRATKLWDNSYVLIAGPL